MSALFIDNGALILPQSGGINITAANHHNASPGITSVLYIQALVIGGGITGFTSGEANRVLMVQPTRNSSEEVVIYDNNSGSTSGNRVLTANRTFAATSFWGATAMFIYDSVDGFWKEVG